MELPVSKSSYAPSADALVRAVQRARVVFGRVVAQEQAIDHAVCFTNARCPGVRLANFAELDLRAAPDAAGPLAAVEDHFARHDAVCQILQPTDGDGAAALAAVASDYDRVERHVLLHEGAGPHRAGADDLQIIPARASYDQLRTLVESMARLDHGADDRLAAALAQVWEDRLDEPRLDLFLGLVERRAAAVAGVLSLGQIGVVDPVWCHPDRRGRGVAGAMLGHLLEHCRRAMFEQVVVDRGEGCPAISFYESFGFRRVARFTRFKRRLGSP